MDKKEVLKKLKSARSWRELGMSIEDFVRMIDSDNAETNSQADVENKLQELENKVAKLIESNKKLRQENKQLKGQ